MERRGTLLFRLFPPPCFKDSGWYCNKISVAEMRETYFICGGQRPKEGSLQPEKGEDFFFCDNFLRAKMGWLGWESHEKRRDKLTPFSHLILSPKKVQNTFTPPFGCPVNDTHIPETERKNEWLHIA